jgi:hypothetical protein
MMWMAACGSSNTSTVTGLTVGASAATIQSRQMIQCYTSVTGTGTFSPNVTWKANAGTINASGMFTAPVVSVPTLVTITATSTQNTSVSGIAGIVVNPVNRVALTVDAGPEPQVFTAINQAFTTVTVCVPNTTTCQTIDHVLVDTASSGLRLLSSVLTIPLPQQNDSLGNPLDECMVFLNGYVWGQVALADIAIADERAASTPVQVIVPNSASPPVPSSCSSRSMGPNQGDSVAALGANGIIGLGFFQQDCGAICVSGTGSIPPVYYDCPTSGCNPTYVSAAAQVTNPVIKFNPDNNGVVTSLPTVPNGGLTSATGSLIFGIGTQSNNALQSSTVYTVPDSGANAGDITTTFNGVGYPASFFDSSSSGIFFLDSATTGIPTCAGANAAFYCPTTSPDLLSVTNQGANGNQGVVNFSIENADRLLSSGNIAFSTLGGPRTDSFDWGLPFFYGRTVFTAIENMSTPQGPGPYVAY